jgi:hypothetical protein
MRSSKAKLRAAIFLLSLPVGIHTSAALQAGEPTRHCHAVTKGNRYHTSSPVPSRRLIIIVKQPAAVAPATAATANDQGQLRKQLADIAQRMQQRVEQCRKTALQTAEGEGTVQKQLQDHNQEVAASQRLILFARNLLTASESKIVLEGRELTSEQLGGLLATVVEEHQKLLEQGRKLRIDAAAATAAREGADEQLARWQQQQAELLQLVDSLTSDNSLGTTENPQPIETPDTQRLAKELAARLETLLPPPAN